MGEISTNHYLGLKKNQAKVCIALDHHSHVTHFEEADITELENFRKQQQEVAKQQGVKLTYLLFY